MSNLNIFKKYNTPQKGYKFYKDLIKIRGHKCECCGNTEWLGKPINLQVHHIDGDKTNNTLDNLQLLCPNCHSYTDNFGIANKNNLTTISDADFITALKNSYTIREALLKLNLSDAGGNYIRAKRIIDLYNINLLEKEKSEPLKQCPECGKIILGSSTYCIKCAQLKARTIKRPNRDELKKMIRTENFTSIGKKYNVSDNAIRKWCKSEGLPSTKKVINSYSDDEWKLI